MVATHKEQAAVSRCRGEEPQDRSERHLQFMASLAARVGSWPTPPPLPMAFPNSSGGGGPPVPAHSVRSAKTQPAAAYVPTPRVGEASGQQVPAPIPTPRSNYRACDLHQPGAVEEPGKETKVPIPGEPARKPEVGLQVRPASPPPEAVAPRGLACRMPVSLGLPTPCCDCLLHGRPTDQPHRRR